MKKIYTLFILTCLINGGLKAQSAWDGAWHGKIEAANLRLVFNLKSAENGSISATMDSPDQSAFGLAVDSAWVKEDSLYISDSRFRISFKGKRTNDSTINGVFSQGMDIPLLLKRNAPETKSTPKAKKQTPVPPFPYKEEEVTIENKKSGITLSGTLTIPAVTNGKGYPAVILISGSGPQDRDETIFGHKPFAVLADHLTRQGVIVLRYDDRGTGKSTGDFSSSTSRDFADDAEAVLNYLSARKDINKKQIGLIGHSEGGLIAPLVANENKEVSFIVLLAGPGIPIIDLMTEQNVAIMRSQGLSEAAANAYGSLYKNVMLIARNNDTNEEKNNAIIKVAE
ncbi:MAG: alpha/beta fold hydrolase, partial [Chitinophagaceae bacterium]